MTKAVNTIDTPRTYKPKTKEELINIITNAIQLRADHIKELSSRLQFLQDRQAADMIRLSELRMLKDIKDGRLVIIDPATNSELKVAVYN